MSASNLTVFFTAFSGHYVVLRRCKTCRFDFLTIGIALFTTVRVEFFSPLSTYCMEVFMGKVSDSVFALVSPIAESFGLEVIEVLYEKRYDGMNLTVVIDKDGGVTIDDCERLHRAIDAPLDELDPIDVPYTLNVSSPGIDRPLKLERDYKRNLGKDICVKLYQPRDGKKEYKGTLVAYDAETFTVEANGKQTTFNKKDTAKVEPIIVF